MTNSDHRLPITALPFLFIRLLLLEAVEAALHDAEALEELVEVDPAVFVDVHGGGEVRDLVGGEGGVALQQTTGVTELVQCDVTLRTNDTYCANGS